MKRVIYILLVIFISSSVLMSAEPEKVEKIVKEQDVIEDKAEAGDSSGDARHGVAAYEIISLNVLFAGFNRYSMQKGYALVSTRSIYTNLSNPWVWDDDGFGVNMIGHPYQGSLYYTAARSNNIGFVGSSLYTMAGSVMWEYFCETERPSINDLVNTTMGGIVFGEILGRLSDSIWHGIGGSSTFDKAASVAVSPVSGINRGLFNEKKPVQPLGRIRGDLLLGGGMSTIVLKLDGEEVPDHVYDTIVGDKSNRSFIFAFDVEYGRPYTYRYSAPFDYFEFNLSLGSINNSMFVSLFTKGILWGTRLASTKRNSGLFGIFINYDFIANGLINFSSNSLGAGYQNRLKFTNKTFFITSLQLNFILMGSSDYIYHKYANIIEPGLGGRDYDFSIGENVLVNVGIENREFGKITVNYRYYGLHTFPGSVPDYGSGGYNIIGMLFLNLEKTLFKTWRVGVMLNAYHKESFFDDMPNVNELLYGGRLYAGYLF